MNLRTEKEILDIWGVNEDYQPLVLVVCNTYNHADFIESAIIGFLSQETTFPFRVQIHDDASSDGTQLVIERYYKLYPHIIYPIFEKENLYSKHDGSLAKAIYGNKEGEFIALCEGDDYWIDNRKLEKQVDCLSKHTNCTLCITNGYKEDQSRYPIERMEYFSSNPDEYLQSQKEYEMSLDNCSKMLFPPTASYLYRKSSRIGLDSVPSCPNGDLRIRLFLMTQGNAYYLSDKTCVYRVNVNNSAMTRWKVQSRKEVLTRCFQVISMIEYIDRITGYNHKENLSLLKKRHYISILENADTYKILKNKEINKVFKRLSFKRKVKILVKVLIPSCIVNYIRKSRKKGR